MPRTSISKKSISLAIAFFSTVGVSLSSAQVAQDSWATGAGLAYPRLFSSNLTSRNPNFGAYLMAQRNFTEHLGLRLKGSYSHMEGRWDGTHVKADMATTDLAFLYYVQPCDYFTPYVFAGIGGNYKYIDNPPSESVESGKPGGQLGAGSGVELWITPSFSIATEVGYYMTNNSDLDGAIAPSEVEARDSYMQMSVGANFTFGMGPASEKCAGCKPPKQVDMTDYQRIENMVIQHIPAQVERYVSKEVIREVAADTCIVAIGNDRLVVVGVNFAFDKADLLPESYPVLDKGVAMLKAKPEVKIEVDGYTDDVGTLEYNRELSTQRAEVVKTYLVSKGIAANRITTFGYGKRNPVEDNLTENGREMNRRIVFRILK